MRKYTKQSTQSGCSSKFQPDLFVLFQQKICFQLNIFGEETLIYNISVCWSNTQTLNYHRYIHMCVCISWLWYPTVDQNNRKNDREDVKEERARHLGNCWVQAWVLSSIYRSVACRQLAINKCDLCAAENALITRSKKNNFYLVDWCNKLERPYISRQDDR